MSCFKINVLITQFLHFVFERGDVAFQRLWSTTKVRHCTHYTCSFNGSSNSTLISIAEETAESTFNVSVYCKKLSKQLDVSPVNVILINLPQVLLALFISIQRFKVMPKGLMRFELIIGTLHSEFARPVIRGRIKLALSEILELMEEVSSALSVHVICRTNTRVRGVSTNILTQSNINNVLNCEAVIRFEVDLTG